MIVLALVLSFLCGSIPFGVLIGKSRGVDVRAVGSGNTGATNSWRAMGPIMGILVFALDVAKGVAGPLLGHWLAPGQEIGIAACGIVAVLGHIFSPFLGFKGGKGIATSLGALFGLMPIVGILIFAFWGVMLAFTRMISAASIMACVALPIFALIFHNHQWPYIFVALLMSLVASIKHIPNMKRIKAGTEPRVGRKKAEA